MSLPDLIEIVPLEKPVAAELTVPGSKSITNRALILAALAEGEVTLTGALWSEDTQIMVECLQDLGFMVDVRADANEACNRTITVYGRGGAVPPGGTEEQPLDLFVGNAGTAARFLAAFVCLGKGVYRLHGVPRMHERPQAALFKALRELGYRVESPNDRLPAMIYGTGPAPGAHCTASIEESSQFVSALLLCAKAGGWRIEEIGENAEESPYVMMTLKLIDAFPRRGGTFEVEPDASSGSYFWAAGWLVAVSVWMTEFLKVAAGRSQKDFTDQQGLDEHVEAISRHFQGMSGWFDGTFHQEGPRDFRRFFLKLRNWPDSDWQIDAAFPRYVPLPVKISREWELGDSIMTAIVLAADKWGGWGRESSIHEIYFSDLARLRVQECERVHALRTELTRCGGKVVEKGDTLTVYPSQLHGAEIETYDDHRMAMCFAILGLKVAGIKIKNPGCVKKTFPNFFQKLAAPAPHGLGATILDSAGKRLKVDQLFAD